MLVACTYTWMYVACLRGDNNYMEVRYHLILVNNLPIKSDAIIAAIPIITKLPLPTQNTAMSSECPQL